MRHRIAIILSATALPLIAGCTPANAPAPDANANMADSTDDELLDTSPDSLRAPDDANAVSNHDDPAGR